MYLRFFRSWVPRAMILSFSIMELLRLESEASNISILESDGGTAWVEAGNDEIVFVDNLFVSLEHISSLITEFFL